MFSFDNVAGRALEQVTVRVGEVCVSLCIAMQGCTTLIMLMFRFVNVAGGALEQVAVRVGEVCARLWITVQGRSTLLMLMFSFVNVAGGALEQVAVRVGEVCVRLWITVQGRSTLLMLMFSFVNVAGEAGACSSESRFVNVPGGALEQVAVRVGEVCARLWIIVQGRSTLLMLMFSFVNVAGEAGACSSESRLWISQGRSTLLMLMFSFVNVAGGALEQVAVRVGEVCVRLWITAQGRSTLLMLMFSFVNVAGEAGACSSESRFVNVPGGALEQVAVRVGEVCARLWITVQGRSTLLMLMFSLSQCCRWSSGASRSESR
ncbi:hypothetical protein J6590_079144 [Homalodisca vitripennis]|nr:hypothetical protein J6590_079144 [Homalodisca vitripennis]